MLRYKTKTRPGLVSLYDIRPGNGAGPFLQPRSPHGAWSILRGGDPASPVINININAIIIIMINIVQIDK